MGTNLIHHIGLFFKGFGVGAANVIPGVSGGTVALITGIFEKLIYSIKSIDLKAFRFLFSGQFREFADKINFFFLLAVFSGVVVSIFTVAKILEFLFLNYPVYIWAYFFGLILASVWFVGKTIRKWTITVILFFMAGTIIAGGITYMNPATQNENFLYLVLCGIVAVSSMILPGLSGSFVLILMGNYELVAIEAINHLRLDILFPLFLGIVVGLIAFSHVLSWLIRKFREQSLATLVGFVMGSLVILWPWKREIYRTDESGNQILTKSGDLLVQSYERFLPESFSTEVFIAILFILGGIITIWLMEVISRRKSPYSKS